MKRNVNMNRSFWALPLAVCVSVSMLGLPVLMTGCDKTEDSSKTKSTKVTKTPEGTKTTTETTEKKTETDQK